MSTPSISVLTPVFNGAKYLPEAIESLLPQLGPGDELIVQDGGSTDGTVEYLRTLEDPRIQWRSEPDGGQTDALNRGLQIASNGWVCWLNADDTIAPDALSRYREVIEKADGQISVIYGGYSVIDADGSETARSLAKLVTFEYLLLGWRLPFSGAMCFRKEFLQSIGSFDDSYNYCMDYELYLRIWSQVGRGARRIDRVMASFRIHEGTKTTSRPWAFVAEARRARKSKLRPNDVKGHLLAIYATAQHGLTVMTTGVRATKPYRRVRALLGPRR